MYDLITARGKKLMWLFAFNIRQIWNKMKYYIYSLIPAAWGHRGLPDVGPRAARCTAYAPEAKLYCELHVTSEETAHGYGVVWNLFNLFIFGLFKDAASN
jgi:hypothetical protein